MAYSKTFLLLGLLFAAVLIIFSTEVSARDMDEAAGRTLIEEGVDAQHSGHGHGHGGRRGHAHGHGHGQGHVHTMANPAMVGLVKLTKLTRNIR